MKKIFATGLVLLSLSSFANEKGNGGISYVCRDAGKKIISARLLDLWEPETFSTYQDFEISEDEQLKDAINKIRLINPKLAGLVELRVDIAKQDRFDVKKPLALTQDALPDYDVEVGCQFEQVANYGYVNETGEFKLRINEKVYLDQNFSNSDRAALWIHEALYALDRDFNKATDSRKSRRLTAKLFSSKAMSADEIELLSTLIPSSYHDAELKGDQLWLISFNGFKSNPNADTQSCSIDIKQNNKSVVDGNWGNFKSNSNVFLGLVAQLKPGVAKLTIKCTQFFTINLKVRSQGQNITPSLFGANEFTYPAGGSTYEQLIYVKAN